MTEESALPRTFVLITESESAALWLKQIIEDMAEPVVCDYSSLDRILRVVDSAGALLVIVHLPKDAYSERLARVEELHAAKPLLPILVFSESLDQDLALDAMRSGASDLITKDTAHDVARKRLRHALEKSPQFSAAGEHRRGRIIALASARPDADSALFSLHLALALRHRSPDTGTLLLDLGVPEGDTLLFLGLRASYSFVDAVRSTRRFDEALIESAFVKHHSGLALLAMPEEAASDEISANDVIVLLNVLRGYYTYIVMNLGGLPRSQFLQLALSHADDVLLLCEQTVPSCRGNRKLMEFFQKNRLGKHIELIVDRYLDKQEPDAEEIAERLGIPLRTVLPPSGFSRLTMKNSGQTLFECAPKDKYTQTVEQLARSFCSDQPEESPRTWFAFTRWFRRS